MIRRSAPVLLLITLAVGTGCGGSDAGESTQSPDAVPEPAPATAAAPEPARAEFAPLPSTSPESQAVSGELLLSPDRTDITISLTGLQPDETYTGHVHEQACADDEAGPHFKFDPSGPDTPPNEVHFELQTGPGETSATTSTTAAQPLPDGARSVVVHDPAEAKMVCADLPAPS